MKKVTRFAVCIMLAAVVGFSSCVKTEVSPEVTALRQTQVDKLKADINQILANTSITRVTERNNKMVVTFDSLNKAFLLKQNNALYAFTEAQRVMTLAEAQADLDARLKIIAQDLVRDLANIANQVEIEKRFMAQNQLATAQAVANYNKFIAMGNFQQNVTDLLGKYNNESAVLQQLYNDRVVLNQQIATGQLLLAAGTGPLTWDAVKAQLQVQLAEKTAALTAAEAALTSLQGVYDNPATLDATRTALSIQIKDLADQNAALDIQVQTATNTLNDANTAVTNANTVITNMGTIEASIVTKNTAITAKNAAIVTATTALATANAGIAAPTTALALANSTLTSASSSFASAQSAYDLKLAAYNTANTTYTTALNDVAAKTVARDIALNNWNADLTNTALQTIYDNAVTALATANTALTAANTALTSANTARTAAQGVLTTATTARNTAQTNVTTAQGTLTTAQAAVVTAQTNLTTLNNDKATLDTDLAILVANKANTQVAYDAAVANIAALRTTANTANNEKVKLVADEAANAAMQTALGNVYTLLGTQYAAITAAIDAQKLIISNLKLDIAQLNEDIANNAIDKTAAEGQIVKLQAKLAETLVKITESEAIVAKWKKLLDDAIAGKF